MKLRKKLTIAVTAVAMMVATVAPASADTDQQVVTGTVATNLVITFNLVDPVDLGSMVIGLPNEAPGGTIDIDANTDWTHSVKAVTNSLHTTGAMVMYENATSNAFGCLAGGSLIFTTALADCDAGAIMLTNGMNVNGTALTSVDQILTTGNGNGSINLTIGQPVVNDDDPTTGTAIYRGTVTHTVTAA